jgi:hypothetical protein
VAPALVVVGATQALACSCVPARPDKVAVKDAKAVFAGTLVDIEDGIDVGFDNVTWTFEVDEVYKGDDVTEMQDVGSQTQSAACGLVFKEEKRYLVFAYDNKGDLETNSCMNTRPLGEDEELDLEPVAAFEPQTPPDGPDVGTRWSPAAIGSFGVVVLIALVTLGVFVAGGRGRAKSPGGPETPGDPPA